MAKNNWVKALMIIGGFALLAKVLEEAKKNDNQIYRCWRCNQIISKNTALCPNCSSTQDWRGMQ